MIILLSSLAYLAAGFVGAAPVPLTYPTGPAEPSYVAHSGRRGTIDILLSSVITLTLCVYTSIHLNITPARTIFGIQSVWVYKFYWVLIATFAPEFVLYAAYLQWRNAWELRKQLKKLGGEPHRTLVQEIVLWFVNTLRRTVAQIESWFKIVPGWIMQEIIWWFTTTTIGGWIVKTLYWPVVQQIRLWFAKATSWIVNTLRRTPTTLPGTSEQPEITRPELKQPEVVQQEVLGLNSEKSGLERRDLVQLDAAERQQSDQPESVPLDSEYPHPKQPTIQRQGRMPPDATHPNSTRPDSILPDSTVPDSTQSDPTQPDSTPPDLTQSDSIQPASTQTDPTLPNSTTLSNPASPGKELWCQISMVSAFYIVMGGFAYNTSDISDDYPYVALTPEGFMEFAKAELITPDILNDKDIADRSKADSLGKLLVCVQALWMVVNCIARKASGRPTTLIELNVIVHVVVAVVVYGLWWYKPLAVANPTLLPRPLGGQEILEILVTLKMERWPQDYYNIYPEHPADANHKRFNVDIKPYTLNTSLFEVRGSPDPKTNWARHVAKLKIKTPGVILLPGQFLRWKKDGSVYGTRGHVVHISGKALHLWALVSPYSEREEYDQFTAAAKMNRVFQVSNSTTYDPPNYSVQGSVYTGGIVSEGFNFSVMDNVALLFMTGLLSCFYAGAHASAWSSHFPSYIERWIWRGACICIATGVPFVCAVCIPLRVVKNFALYEIYIEYSDWRRTVGRCLYTSFKILFWVFLGFAAVLYILSRLFIPLEAFISLRSLPRGAFDTVNWVEYWPHV